jgi:2-polyprenyl-3-methyl-5-hydroxy-6-metoxy-1,4-benzoquinol methylase
MRSEKELIKRIVQSYESPIIRSYCMIRFIILRQRFLDEIHQYLPESGNVIDIGCGFGLFSLYFASVNPNLRIHGIDLNQRRIEIAQKTAERLGIQNVSFAVGDAREYRVQMELDGAYMLDLVHHIPESAVKPLIGDVINRIRQGGTIVVKDVDRSPFYKMAFTWLLDKVMDYRAPVNYWEPEKLMALLQSCGTKVVRHAMNDILPYPHIIYIGRK